MNFLSDSESKDRQVFLSPFLDLMFLLLSFFMLDSLFSELGNKMDIELPQYESEGESQFVKKNEIIINVLEKGKIEINQIKMNLDEFHSILGEAKKETKNLPNISIRADKSVSYQNILTTLNICYKNGFNKISIFVNE